MKLTALQPFSWAHRGVDVEQYEAGQDIETDDADLIRVSTYEGWAASDDAEMALTPALDDDLEPLPVEQAEAGEKKTTRGKRPTK